MEKGEMQSGHPCTKGHDMGEQGRAMQSSLSTSADGGPCRTCFRWTIVGLRHGRGQVCVIGCACG
jgi:hypothetical protein